MEKTFEVFYQVAGATTGLPVQMDVYKPDKSKDESQSGAMVEIGTTGRYYKAFNADAENWSVQCSDINGGKAVKVYDKSAFDTHGVAQLVADVQTAIGAVSSAITTLQLAITGIDDKADTLITNMGGIDSAITVLATQLTTIGDKIDALESPPMIG